MDIVTREILSRFSKSWTETELRFDDLINNYSGFDKLIPIKIFISKLRQNGEEKYFRLGTSVHDLLISRSVNFGLRIDQKYIRIETFDNSFRVSFRDGEKTYREYKMESLEDDRLKKLLQTLKMALVD